MSIPTHHTRPLRGLVLAGGHSRRMGRDKASLCYHAPGLPQWRYTSQLLSETGLPVCLSVRPGQALPGWSPNDPPVLPDQTNDAGPLAGLLAALEAFPGEAIFAVACDLPLLDTDTLRTLIAARQANALAIAYHSTHDGLPEPLCTIYEPDIAPILRDALHSGFRCPRKILIQHAEVVRLIKLPKPDALDNANTPEDFFRLKQSLQNALPLSTRPLTTHG
ncbi:NTP transferase domain-containing protein [Ruficoccus amylovorans]|uniref:Probable molybdenum cofactor guanylyltransferase n=1 Tax=Ruficoccus amylovorans TaxID=1804625 RepID=A0A842HH27_9BACT|nr:NTP transferase domain-containing protein [Ruficoccus amylovorans]MBC2595480.1 NTP transferase domain-containing protein [Ruficoccus amylovorans]